jgi:membrane associated rhomboid family serine protease
VFFLPIKADFSLPRWPILTALVCLIRLAVFLKQQSDWAHIIFNLFFFVAFAATVEALAGPLMFAASIVGGDIFRLFANDDHGVVNVMAHVTGGFAGYLFGLAFLRRSRERAKDLMFELDVKA